MLSLSTAFNCAQARSWKKLLAETGKLGFSALELNVEIPSSWMKDIVSAVEKGRIIISSLHNYCPALENIPEGRTIYSGYHLTAEDDEERRQAVENTLVTIDWAARVGARAVVIHSGEVVTEPSGREFFKYIMQFGHEGKLYLNYVQAIRDDRKRQSPRFRENLFRSLDAVLPRAIEKNICLGLENRFFLHEIPDVEEVPLLLERYPDRHVGYWHDTGHAEVFVRQGWIPRHTDYLQAAGDRIIGFHLHDLRKLTDHFAPGSGDFDFSIITPFVTEKTIKVVEAHARSTSAEVRASIAFLKEKGIS